MTADDFRDIALSMQGAIEGSHMNHPDFRANGRIFATLHPGERMGMVKLTPDEQRAFMDRYPKVFVPSSGAWGRQGCTNVLLALANERVLRAALAAAAKNVSRKK